MKRSASPRHGVEPEPLPFKPPFLQLLPLLADFAVMRILLAEDDPVAREIMISIIPDGYVVFEASCGEETLAFLIEASEKGRPFDLLILGLELPDVSGLEVLSTLRGLEEPRKLARGSYTKVLIVSGDTHAKAIYDAHTLACDGYLIKPIDRKRFSTELERLCPKS